MATNTCHCFSAFFFGHLCFFFQLSFHRICTLLVKNKATDMDRATADMVFEVENLRRAVDNLPLRQPHDPVNACVEIARPGCRGHPMTRYHCGAMCHDCRWGGCACTSVHCCCPGPEVFFQQDQQGEPVVDQQDEDEDEPSVYFIPRDIYQAKEQKTRAKARRQRHKKLSQLKKC